ncbi:aldehyde dehydrogenase (NADP(+)) [Plantibacter flavus]|uniref:aldehyde dehydrogenase (NADP(+)) n=1 Tax=Plantibacter flavus TaxID=150123 RepID=UPI00099DFCA3|nr:aldehyde dehydrogenase (NADP(+)) [Plantibacter flavus]AQX79447.1 aldehyde dehydrogenase (NADP(+)) [Plantibacter flavus]
MTTTPAPDAPIAETTHEQLEEVLRGAAAAAPAWAATPADARASALVAVADALQAHADELVPVGMVETGLAEARLRGELLRTAVQLRLFAETIVDGSYLDVRIDEADPDFALGARPELRRVLVPLGPVVNFAASNFPFAFSVAGGDTASILAAGCPVILKVHDGHPRLSLATAAVVEAALRASGAPDGVFQTIIGQEAGVVALQDERVRAGSFTGSLRAGRILADLAAARPVPIPFFGELGSVNPVFVTQTALDESATAIATGFVTSVAGSAGQLCTKPGFVYLPDGAGLDESIREAAAAVPEHRLLNDRITAGYQARRDTILGTDGVRIIAEGSLRVDEDGDGWATPTIIAVSLDALRAGRDALLDEAFGPLSILVEVPAGTALAPLVPEFCEGNLTATLHAGADETSDDLVELVQQLSAHAGRVLFGGWPTGVAVTPAMQHGGPWPATTNDSSTSVGTAAITRFLRPVAFQNMPDRFLPEVLRSSATGVPRTIAPAGESTHWGEAAQR